MTVYVCEGSMREERVQYLTKQCQFEYSTALDGKGEVRAVKDGDEVIIWKNRKEKVNVTVFT